MSKRSVLFAAILASIVGCEDEGSVAHRLERSRSNVREIDYGEWGEYTQLAHRSLQAALDIATAESLQKPRLVWVGISDLEDIIVQGTWLENEPSASGVRFSDPETGNGIDVMFTELTSSYLQAESNGVVFSFIEKIDGSHRLAEPIRQLRPLDAALIFPAGISNTVAVVFKSELDRTQSDQ